MTPLARRAAVIGLISLTAAAGGIALGNFALSDPPPARMTGANELAAEVNASDNATESAARVDLAPDHYSCQGCDAGRGNQATGDGFEPFDSAPLPPYRPAPSASLDDVPVIAADRSAPDAVRRRAALPGADAAGAQLPAVLAADRRATAPPPADNAAQADY